MGLVCIFLVIDEAGHFLYSNQSFIHQKSYAHFSILHVTSPTLWAAFPFFNGVFFIIYLVSDFGLHWVFVAGSGLCLVVPNGGYSLLRCVGFSLWWLLLLQNTGSRTLTQ